MRPIWTIHRKLPGGVARFALGAERTREPLLPGAKVMTTIADSLFATAPIGQPVELPRAGSWLENDYVYDATAREIKRRAQQGCVEIVQERQVAAGASGDEPLITHLAFRRLC
jgi:hypothetical protein